MVFPTSVTVVTRIHISELPPGFAKVTSYMLTPESNNRLGYPNTSLRKYKISQVYEY